MVSLFAPSLRAAVRIFRDQDAMLELLRKQPTLVVVAGLIAERMPAEVLLLEGGQDHKTAETDVIKCTVRDVAQKWRRAGEGKTLNNVRGLLPHAGIQKSCVNLRKKTWNPC